MKASFFPYRLEFKQASGTSRGILKTKETWFIKIEDEHATGFGECGMFRGLSCDDRPDFESKLKWVCNHIDLGLEQLLIELIDFPSIQFGLEMAFLDLLSDSSNVLFPSKFTSGKASIPINGLIWMGDEQFMKSQIRSKIDAGFDCLKIKIGAIDFDTELSLIKAIRKEYDVETIELRVDANGAFSPLEAMEKLKRLSDFNLHSIEQPIRQGQHDAMAKLCAHAPLPIALDEELIGIHDVTKRGLLLQTINPQYIILKPTLIGGFSGSQSWIDLAEKQSVDWWITSALESNIGLNAIAQWTYQLNVNRPQGLGTGALYTNNIEAPLKIDNGRLIYAPSVKWTINF
ncbi:O-succinylbenzoate synthase [Formosa sp. Hel3_A1_48]|uniref:o-succinylbenzoate synthase n=1 Tax=Formosa sp. Hel3_A1_48 TaxID=1336795 RepID=UPI00084E13A7|nr:o-succinylbenzoate synthase [Formosa sp. Hel3_A1_48]AOR26943.1 O-succinylbenzoate synthase [Formosa sp. Hel3_A1_48]